MIKDDNINTPHMHQYCRPDVTEIKYPSYENPHIDEDIKLEPTFSSHLDNLVSFDSTIEKFILHYEELLLNSGKVKIHTSFPKYEVNPHHILLHAIMIKRKVELIFLIMKGMPNKFETGKQFEENIRSRLMRSISQVTDEEIREIDRIIEIELNNERLMLQVNKQPGIYVVDIAIKYFKLIFERCIKHLIKLNTADYTEETLLNLLNECSKFYYISYMLRNSLNSDYESLYNLKETSEEWIRFKRNYKQITLFSYYNVKKKMKKVRKMLTVAIASVYTGFKDPDYTMREMLRVGYYLLYYSAKSRKAIIESVKFSVNPKFQVAQRLWSLFDSFGLKQISQSLYPKINFRKALYVLKREKEITIEYLKYLTDLI